MKTDTSRRQHKCNKCTPALSRNYHQIIEHDSKATHMHGSINFLPRIVIFFIELAYLFAPNNYIIFIFSTFQNTGNLDFEGARIKHNYNIYCQANRLGK